MLYRHVFDTISTEFSSILRVFVNFADLPEFRGSATARNIRSPVKMSPECIATQLLSFLFSPPHFFSFPFPVFSFCWTFTRLHFVGKIFWKHQDHSLLFFLHGIFSMLFTWFLNFSFAHFTESHLFGHGLKDFFYLHKLGV